MEEVKNFADCLEVQDETDAAPVFTVIDKSEIPDTFLVQSGQPVRNKSSHYHVVSLPWGEVLSPGSEHVLGLLTLEGGPIPDKETAMKVVKNLIHKLPNQVAALRWNKHQILLSFDSNEAYGNFGNRLLEGKLDPGEDLDVTLIKPAQIGALTRVSITVTTNRSADLHPSLVDSIVRFWSTVNHLRIVSDPTAPDPLPESQLPHMCFTMLFGSHGQRNALTSIERLSQSPWKPLTLETDVKKLLNLGSTFYQNTLGGPMIGVETGCPTSGVKLTVFVQRKENFDKMASFYQDLLESESAPIKHESGEARYWLYPLQKALLMVAYFPGFTVSTSPELELMVKVAHLDKMADYGQPRDGSLIKDPEGNPIVPIHI